MKLFVEKLTKLIEVKKIIALMMTVTLVVMAFMNKITSEQFMPLAIMIISYYFGASTMRETPGDKK